MKRKIVTDLENGSKVASQLIWKNISEAQRHGKTVLLLCSGGSAVSVFDSFDVEKVTPDQLTIGLIDERVTPEYKDLNFPKIVGHPKIAALADAGAELLPLDQKPDENPQDVASRYQELLRRVFDVNPELHVLAVLGVGADGHTAGVLPWPKNPESVPDFSALFLDPDTWVSGYDSSLLGSFPGRATVALSFLEQCVDSAIVFAVGEPKHPTLQTILSKPSLPLSQYPALVLHKMPDVTLVTDYSS